MHEQIDVTVAAIVESSGRFLIVEEQCRGVIVLNQPAGHLEPEESLVDAVVRETREETGYAFEPHELVGIYLWHSTEADRSFLRITFTGRAEPPAATPTLDDGIIASHWLTPAQLLQRERELRSPLVMRAIDDYRAGIRFPLDTLSYLARDYILDLEAKTA